MRVIIRKKEIMILTSILSILIITSSCVKSEEKVNEEIIQMTTNLLSCNWQIHNIQMTYEDYKEEVADYFIDKETFKDHIKHDDLNPIILEDVTKNDAALIEKYKTKNIFNYDLLNIQISKVYGEATSSSKYCYIHMIVSPHIPLQKENGVAYTGTGYTFKEERNIMILWTKENNNWKISDFQGNAYLLDLKDKLSKEFISRYTTYNNTPVEYIHTFELINE